MRKSLTSLLLVVAITGSLLTNSRGTVGAAVPDKPFTATQCEGYSDSVARLYTAGLGRPAEQGGFDFWITEYTLGNWSFPAMAQFFVNSDEFQASYGNLTQDQFVRQLYRNVLGREGETGGVEFWNQQMTTGTTRATVLMRFAESAENIQRTGTVEPTLGVFNEGRSVVWRCGPSLAASLLTIEDFSIDWGQEFELPRAPLGVGCDSALRMPDDIDQVSFYNSDGGTGIRQGSYIAPTEYGAERYLAQIRQALDDCSSFDSPYGYSETISEMAFPSYGDNSIALRLRRTYPGEISPIDYDRVVIRDGVVVTVVQNYSEIELDSELTEAYATLAAQRLAAFPLGN